MKNMLHYAKAGKSNYIPQIPWDVITYPCPWYESLWLHYDCQMDAFDLFTHIFRLASLVLGQPYGYSNGSQATLKNIGKFDSYKPQQK